MGTIERTSSARVIKLGASVSVTVPLTEGLGRHLPVMTSCETIRPDRIEQWPVQPSTSIFICEVTTGVSKIKLLFKFKLELVFPVATVVDPPTC